MSPQAFDTFELVLEELQAALDQRQMARAVEIFASLRPADMAAVFDSLEQEEQMALLSHLPASESADILEELDDEEVAEIIATLSNPQLVRIMDEMEPDEAADLLGDIQPERAEELLSDLEDEDELRPLLIHLDESAGGLMTSKFLALRRRMTVADALAALRAWQPDAETIYYLFVVDAQGRLSGVLDLRRFLIADPHKAIQEIMSPDVVFVQAGADQEEAARLMVRYDLLALPVVDEENHLLGVITYDDVMDVLEEEATEDIQRLGGAQPLKRSYLDISIFSMTRKRIGWLLLLFLTATLTGSVMRLFQWELEVMASLAIFIPLIIGTGGNAGSQTTATIIRALATGDIEWQDLFRVWWREARVGLLLGLGMCLAAYIRSVTWEPNPELGLTVAVAIMGIVLWANSAGAILPIVAARLKIDPTVVSGPVMSTLVDATGLFIYFSLARLILIL